MIIDRNKKNRSRPWLFKAAVLVVVSALLAFAFAGSVFAVDLTVPNSVTVNIQDGFQDDPGLTPENLIVDIYMIAQARDDIAPAAGFDTYTLVATEAFGNLQEAIDNAQIQSEDSNLRWDNLAQDAVKMVRNGKGGKPAASGHAGEVFQNVEAGLYLVLMHGELDSYYYDDDGNAPVTTMAVTAMYEYHFIPGLAAFPYKESFQTSGNDEWKNDRSMVLKGERLEKEKPTPPPEDDPKTGDNNHMFREMMMVIVSGCVLLVFVIIFTGKRKRDKKTDESDR